METTISTSENKNVKNVNATKKVVDLTNPTKKQNFLDAKKEQIKKGEKATKDIFQNLDFVNIANALKNVNVEKVKNVNERHFIYKFEREGLNSQKAQSMRTKIRKQINKKIDNVLFYFKEKDLENLKNSVKDFKEFYLKTYILNDYSINSIYANHVDEDKKNKLKLCLDIITKLK